MLSTESNEKMPNSKVGLDSNMPYRIHSKVGLDSKRYSCFQQKAMKKCRIQKLD